MVDNSTIATPLNIQRPAYGPAIADWLTFLHACPLDRTLEYYALSLTADARGQTTFGAQSHFIGWHDVGRRAELRRASLMTDQFSAIWADAGQACLFVTRHEDVVLFMLAGGNAMVERTVAEEHFPRVLEPRIVYPHGKVGFVAESAFPNHAFRRAPTPKLRMTVLQRDGRRCRICGRRPDDHVDVELHVHHIRPWEHGGLTDSDNLITLCHTCHSGLNPHFDHTLFEYLALGDREEGAAGHMAAVLRYRELTQAALKSDRDTPAS